jgi:hypothetical protein
MERFSASELTLDLYKQEHRIGELKQRRTAPVILLSLSDHDVQ